MTDLPPGGGHMASPARFFKRRRRLSRSGVHAGPTAACARARAPSAPGHRARTENALAEEAQPVGRVPAASLGLGDCSAQPKDPSGNCHDIPSSLVPGSLPSSRSEGRAASAGQSDGDTPVGDPVGEGEGGGRARPWGLPSLPRIVTRSNSGRRRFARAPNTTTQTSQRMPFKRKSTAQRQRPLGLAKQERGWHPAGQPRSLRSA